MLFSTPTNIDSSLVQSQIALYGGQGRPYVERLVAIPQSVISSNEPVATKIGEWIFACHISERIVYLVPEREELVNIFYQYLVLDNDWNGYNGVAPLPRTVFAAEAIVRDLPDTIPLPKPMVSGDGEIGLYWRNADLYAEITFDKNGAASFYGERGDRNYSGENLPATSAKFVANLISELSKP